jgi:hypothetical protein
MFDATMHAHHLHTRPLPFSKMIKKKTHRDVIKFFLPAILEFTDGWICLQATGSPDCTVVQSIKSLEDFGSKNKLPAILLITKKKKFTKHPKIQYN